MEYKDMENVTILNHPLIQHKISRLRDRHTGTNEFRRLVEEIAMLEGYEALSDLPVEEVEVETPLETCMTPGAGRTEVSHRTHTESRTWHGAGGTVTGAIRQSRTYRNVSG